MRKSIGVPEANWLATMFPKTGYPTHRRTSQHYHPLPSKPPMN